MALRDAPLSVDDGSLDDRPLHDLARRFEVLADLAAARADRISGATPANAIARAALRREAFAYRCTAQRVAHISVRRARSWLLRFLSNQGEDPVVGLAYRRMHEDLAHALGEGPATSDSGDGG